MHHRQTHGQHFLRLEQMPQIGPGEIPAYRTAAGRVNGLFVQLVLLVFDVQAARPGKQLSGTGVQ